MIIDIQETHWKILEKFNSIKEAEDFVLKNKQYFDKIGLRDNQPIELTIAEETRFVNIKFEEIAKATLKEYIYTRD